MVVLVIPVKNKKIKILKMKYLFYSSCTLLLFFITETGCRTSKRITKAIAPKDTIAIIIPNQNANDSLEVITNTINSFNAHHINFKTFSAKIKVDYEDSKGKQPDFTAKVDIIRDSAIKVSITATIINLEVFRILITQDSVILMNKREKEVQYRSIDFLQETTQIPFDYNTLQDMLIGNPVFTDSNIVSFKRTENTYLVGMVGEYFKHLLTLSADNKLMQHTKLDDTDITRNRTADITYSDYETRDNIIFSTYRDITVSEKTRLNIQMKYKQWEFNKELSISFNVPKNYKRT